MLLREDDRGVLAIGQPSHAWLSGQLARAWGNERFGRVEPFEEVCLAAEQHDVGWARHELEPLHNPDTGLPRSFVEVPLDVHLSLWSDAPHLLLAQSRYAALLVSMHGWRLYERRDLAKMPAAEADAVRRFLAEQTALHDRLLGLLRDEETGGDLTGAAVVERNSLLIWTWDYISLALCQNWTPAAAKGAPTADGVVDIEITREATPGRWRLEPWPFDAGSVVVRCEGRRLDGRCDNEDAMRRSLEDARWETVELELRPA
jgi:hypothetical protein